MNKETSGIRISDIAEMAGVSVGTVDRVIHNRGRVSVDNEQKVKAVLEKVNYQPNLLARSLASKKQYRLVAIIPSFEEGAYWEAISEGIELAASEFEPYNVSVRKLYFNQYNSKTFDDVIHCFLEEEEEVDGVLVATLFTESVVRLSRLLNERSIPYVYVDSNIQGQHQLAYFGTESYDAGWIAAKLLTDRVEFHSDILIGKMLPTNGKSGSHQGRNRKQGFCDYLKAIRFGGQLHEIELSIEDVSYNFLKLDELFRLNLQIRGAVIFNSTCYILGDYLKERGVKDVKLVGYDLIGRNAKLMSDGVITALIAQRPEKQGYNAIKSLSAFLVQKQIPEKVNLMPIDILIKENLPYYLNNKL